MKLINLKQKAEDTQVFSFRLPVHTKNNIDSIAKNHNAHPAEVVRYAVDQLVNSVLNS